MRKGRKEKIRYGLMSILRNKIKYLVLSHKKAHPEMSFSV
jgi:hypothetical protein